MQRPDILVLGAGDRAWMAGVLAGLGVDASGVEQIVGTSAGAALAADLLAGVEPGTATPATGTPTPSPPPPGRGRVAAALEPLIPLGLSVGRQASTRLRALALARVEDAPASLDELGARIAAHGIAFDGRLRVVAVDRASGRRVVFGAPGAPEATVAQAVQASSSLPWRHRPVRIGERDYVDGGVWSPLNLDAASAHRDTRVLCLAPTAGDLAGVPRHPAVRAMTSAALALETAVLRRRGAELTVVAPDAAADDEDPRAAGERQGRALATA